VTTRAEARDAINALVKAGADAYNAANNPDVVVVYEDTKVAANAGTTPEFRVFIRHGNGNQSSLGSVGNRKFDRKGVVIVQVFTPIGDGFTLDDTLSTVARNCFEGVTTSNGVWFRRTKVQEVGKTGAFYQTNVTAEFEYTERR
jgi:hypothetical protein